VVLTKANIHEIEIVGKSFKSLSLKENDIEEFLRTNIDVILEDENLLIVGRQVKTKESSRSDLTAVDEDGNLVLIEIKRDLDDIKSRKEPFEIQAIRYAASYAKIKTTEELVEKIFAGYIDKYKDEFERGELTAYEKATRILNSFLEKNNAIKTFNKKQRIILIASSFDPQTLSAVAWLISNNVDICCFALSPLEIGSQLFIDINRILPPLALENFYVEIEDKVKSSESDSQAKTITRTYLPRMDKLFEWGIVKKNDIVVLKGFDSSEATVIDYKRVEYNGKRMSFNRWGEKVTGWSAISIYEWAMIKDSEKTLDQLRREKLEELQGENEAMF